MNKYEIPQNCPFSLPFLTVIAFHRVKKSPLIIGIVDRRLIATSIQRIRAVDRSVHTSANLLFHFSNKNGKRTYYLSLSVRARFGQPVFVRTKNEKR